MQKILTLGILFLSTSFFSTVFAHNQDAKTEQRELDFFLEASFLQIAQSSKITAENTPNYIKLVGPKQNFVYVHRGEISRALEQALKSIGNINSPHDHHHHHHHQKSFLITSLIKSIMESIKNLPTTIPIASAEAVRMAREVGLIPTVLLTALFVPTYALYTPITEGLEFAFLGPFHVFCHFFQVIYFSAFTAIGKQMTDIVSLWDRYQLAKKTQSNKPIIVALKTLFADRRYRKLVMKVFLETSSSVMRKKDYLKQFPAESILRGLFHQSRQWILDYEVKTQKSAMTNLPANPTILRSGIQSDLDSLDLLLRIASTEINHLYKLEKISYSHLLKAKNEIGQLAKSLNKLSIDISVSMEINPEFFNTPETQQLIERYKNKTIEAIKKLKIISSVEKNQIEGKNIHKAIATSCKRSIAK